MPTDTTNLDATFHTPGTNRLLADLAAVRPEAVIVQSDDDATTPDLDGLQMVVDAVRRSDDRTLDMGEWEDSDSACGFAGCAIGWHCYVNRNDPLKMVNGSPAFGQLGGWDAVNERFGLSVRDTDYLFFTGTYEDPTRAAVIARFEQL